MAEGTFDQVLGRVDNFAAGFLAAGASTVVAEGHTDPAALIAAAINGPAALARAFNGASWRHGNTATYASTRTAGAVVTLDPDKQGAGFYRSLVQGAGQATQPPQVTQRVGPAPGRPAVARIRGRQVRASVRRGHGYARRADLAAAADHPGRGTAAEVAHGRRALAAAGAEHPVGQRGHDRRRARRGRGGLRRGGDGQRHRVRQRRSSSTVPTPKDPGTYVVLMTLATADGTPYDVATQALLRPFTVVVPKPVDLRSRPRRRSRRRRRCRSPCGWTSRTPAPRPGARRSTPTCGTTRRSTRGSTGTSRRSCRSRATWLDPVTGAATPAASYPLPRGLGAPGHAASVDLAVRAPDEPGHYLLMLSLAARGNLGDVPAGPAAGPGRRPLTRRPTAPPTSRGPSPRP